MTKKRRKLLKAIPNRSRAIQVAVRGKLDRARRRRLAEEVTKLNPKEERALAEEGFTGAVGHRTR